MSTNCYMSKRTYGHELVLTSRRLVRTAAEDDFLKLTELKGNRFLGDRFYKK